MRMAASIATAAALHGIVFGVTAAVLSRQPVPRPVPPVAPVDVELVAARPDPIAAPPAPLASPTRSARVAARHHQPPPPPAAPEAAAPAPERAPAAVEPVAPAAPPEPATPTVPARPGPASAAAKSPVVSAVPRYRSNVAPDYPVACRRRGEEGVVLLNVTVSAGGLPTAISLNRSSGHPLLDQAALDAVHRWTFEPGRAGDVPVSTQVVVPVRFSLAP